MPRLPVIETRAVTAGDAGDDGLVASRYMVLARHANRRCAVDEIRRLRHGRPDGKCLIPVAISIGTVDILSKKTHLAKVSRSAYCSTSVYSRNALHSGHPTSFHSFVVRSVLIDVRTHSRQVIGSWPHSTVREHMGNSAPAFSSVQTTHSLAAEGLVAQVRCFVTVAPLAPSVPTYFWPKLPKSD